MKTNVPEVLWTPDPAVARASAIAQFARFVGERRLAGIDELDYPSLHAWSVGDLDVFWAAAAGFLGVRFHDPPRGHTRFGGHARHRVVPRRDAQLCRART